MSLKTALLQIYRVLLPQNRSESLKTGHFLGIEALLWKHRALLQIYRALLQIYKALLWIYRALLWIYKALLRIYRALLRICMAPLHFPGVCVVKAEARSLDV